VTAGLTVEDKHFVKWLCVKSVKQNARLRCFLREDELWWAKNTDQTDLL